MRKHSQEEDLEINMTPMLDIVFIMLIFFIVTASFVKEAGVDVNKVAATQWAKRPLASVLVGITETDQVWINRSRVDLKSVRAVIESLYLENPRGSIVIQADEKAKSGIMLKVVDALKQAGVPDNQVSVSVEEG